MSDGVLQREGERDDEEGVKSRASKAIPGEREEGVKR